MSGPFSPVQLINQSGPPVLPESDPGIKPYDYPLPEGGIKEALKSLPDGWYPGALPPDAVKKLPSRPGPALPLGLEGIWEQVKSGAPVVGVYAFLAVLIVVGVIMLLSGSSGGQTVVAVVQGEGRKKHKRALQKAEIKGYSAGLRKGWDQTAKEAA